jgi:hypothetical protein
MVECRDTDSKALARDFVKYIQLKEVLRKQFYVYNQLNSSYIKDKDSARVFVMETLSIFDKYNFEDILSYNHLLESKFDVKKIPSTDIDMAISKVIKYKTSMEKVDQIGYVESLGKIIEHVSTFREFDNKLSSLNESVANSQLKFLQPKHVVRIALKKFNERYSSNFDDDDRVVFNTLREGNAEKIDKMYREIVTDFICEFNAFDVGGDRVLAEKLNSVFDIICGTPMSRDNLLNAHELRSELRKLNENK